MRRKQNVIIFSAGESVRNGNVDYIQKRLEEKGILCYDWRSLFKQAHDTDRIALLPSLSKKIPTFDFALIVAEGVDTVNLRGNEKRAAIRDNVIFELGLCVMALGVDRVILLAEESVRIPEDLIGVGKIGIEYVTFRSVKNDGSLDKVADIIEEKTDMLSKKFALQLDEITEHIVANADLISPVFIGAAVSSAEAYFLNFVIRLLENIDKGFSYKDRPETVYAVPDDFSVCIYIPTSVNSLTRSAIADFYSDGGYGEFMIRNAGMRGMFFNGVFDESKNSLLVVDIPTSITASYEVVNSVLNIDADDEYDSSAEKRFVTKEMDIYAFALHKLLSADVAAKRLAFIRDEGKINRILKLLGNVSIELRDIEAKKQQ